MTWMTFSRGVLSIIDTVGASELRQQLGVPRVAAARGVQGLFVEWGRADRIRAATGGQLDCTLDIAVRGFAGLLGELAPRQVVGQEVQVEALHRSCLVVGPRLHR